jgi:hypothetical protein
LETANLRFEVSEQPSLKSAKPFTKKREAFFKPNVPTLGFTHSADTIKKLALKGGELTQ